MDARLYRRPPVWERSQGEEVSPAARRDRRAR